MFFLDSNTCIYFLNGVSESIKKKLLSTSPAEIKISSIVKAELLLGAYKSRTQKKTLDKLEGFLSPFEVIPFDEAVTYEYASIRKELVSQGKIIGPNDLLIASIAKFHKGILVTRNIKEFSRVKGLELENWFDEVAPP